MKNEFEKYPELAELMQEYASFGRFNHWQKFTDALNAILRKSNEELDAAKKLLTTYAQTSMEKIEKVKQLEVKIKELQIELRLLKQK